MALSVGRPRDGVVAEINVTPMADVMIVLLIIFMVAAPIITGAPVRLPEAVHPSQQRGERMEVVVRANGSLAVDGMPLASEELLAEYLDARVPAGTPRIVLIQADRDVSYGTLAPVLRACRRAGAAQIALGAQLRPESLP